MLRNSYPVRESVLKIDSGDYLGSYIFPAYSADGRIYQNVEVVVVGGINGNRSPLVKAFESADRNSDYSLVNINKVRGYKEEVVEVPVDIKAIVDEYNELLPSYIQNTNNDEELDMELHNKVTKLSQELISYFQK